MDRNLLFFTSIRDRISKVLLFLFLFSFLPDILTAQSVSVSYTTPGNYSWTAPCNVTSISVQAWGGGGGGGGAAGNPSTGGGGAGGAFSSGTVTVVGGTTYSITVGAGGLAGTSDGTAPGGTGGSTFFNSQITFSAIGGAGGAGVTAANTYGAGGVAGTSGNTGGTINFYGGNGGTAISSNSGGGGSSAGTGANGNPAVAATAGAAVAGGGAGAAGVTSGNNGGNPGSAPGGGGSGGRAGNNTNQAGGGGGGGRLVITYTTLPYCTPTMSVSTYSINRVQFNTIDNTSSTISGGDTSLSYEVFNTACTDVIKGGSYTLTVTAQGLGTANTFFVNAFFDWNDNGDFSDAGEEFQVGSFANASNVGIVSTGIPVPATAVTGYVKMRVFSRFSVAATPCNSTGYGQAEDYLVNILPAPPCSGTPLGGIAAANPVSGNSGASFTLTASGYSAATGITFQWQSAPAAAGPWTNIAGATTNPYVATGVAAVTTTHYRVIISCSNSSLSANSSTTTFTTTGCSSPLATNPANFYIKRVNFVGTLNDVNQTSLASVNGFTDYSGSANKPRQSQGDGVNVIVETQPRAIIQAWVDWDNDGIFAGVENVYNSDLILTSSTTFGFVVPPAASLGDHKVRIRIYNSADDGGAPNVSWGACGTLYNGEAEDYSLTVVASCPAFIVGVTDGERCNSGPVILNVTGSPGATIFNFYSAQTGGTLVGSSTAGTWTTPDLGVTSTYYVSASNGTCESLQRLPIIAFIKPVPVLSFTPANPVVCGEGAVLQLNANGFTEQGILIDEKFESGSLGIFSVSNSTTPVALTTETQWTVQTSTYVPTTNAYWKPAISSGVGTNKFVFATSDKLSTPRLSLNTSLQSSELSSLTYTNLNLTFDLYYGHYWADGTQSVTSAPPFPVTYSDYFIIEGSVNGGAWTTIQNYIEDRGIGTKFENIALALPAAYVNQANIRIRFRFFADWMQGVAIDNIKLSGTKPLASSFNWTPLGNGNLFTNLAGTIPYTGGSVPNVYIKPTIPQLAAGVPLTFTATASLSNGCSASADITVNIGPSEWTGQINTNWHEANNWCSKTVPTSTTIVLIPNVTNKPVISSAAFAKNVTINTGSSLTINATGTLAITGDVSNAGTLVNNGTISLNGTTVQNFPGAAGSVTAMSVLEINNPAGVVLNKTIAIQSQLKPSAGNLSLGNFDITMNSTATATACVSTLGATASFSYGTGRFIIERFIPTGVTHGKSWQFLAAPVVGQTIKQSWMENAAPNANPNPGFGTQITGVGGAANGFDMASTVPSMKIYDPSNINGWVTVGNPNTTAINNSKGYMIFVRGDRSAIALASTSTPTTLRIKGTILTGNVVSATIPANQLQSVANPYPSAIDFSTLTRSGGTDPNFYLFDPVLTGANGLGGYQTITAVTGYRATPGGTAIYNTTADYRKIQSGQAFFTRATGSDGTLTFKESDKVTGSTLVNRITDNISMFSSTLLSPGAEILDGNRIVFGDSYSDLLDGNDAIKLPNVNQNFGIAKGAAILSVEARERLIDTDTIHYSLRSLSKQNYSLLMEPEYLGLYGFTAALIDEYLHISTPVSLTESTNYQFAVTTDPLSASENRFKLVFTKIAGPLPVTYTKISANRNRDNTISVKWQTENEVNMEKYIVERASDGRNFNAVGQAPASSSADYHFLDVRPLSKNNFYRIKGVGQDGQLFYTSIVKVGISQPGSLFTVFPNPIKDKKLNIEFTGQARGNYHLIVSDNLGKIIFNRIFFVGDSQQLFNFKLPESVASGVYQVKIYGADELEGSLKIVVGD